MPGGTQHQKSEDLRQRPTFLTQSALADESCSSTWCSRRPGTAATAALSGTAASVQLHDNDGMTPNWLGAGSWRTATPDEALARMATARRARCAETERLALMRCASEDLRVYNMARFQDALVQAPCASSRQCQLPIVTTRLRDQLTRSSSSPSKCSLSAYLTLPPPVTVGIDPEEASSKVKADADADVPGGDPREIATGRRRAQLMSQLRLRQPRQPVRYRYDRTAQELCQEGGDLPSRQLCEPYPWQQDYRYNPFPEPKLLAWTRQEQARRLERSRLAEEFDEFFSTPVSPQPTPPASPTTMFLPTVLLTADALKQDASADTVWQSQETQQQSVVEANAQQQQQQEQQPLAATLAAPAETQRHRRNSGNKAASRGVSAKQHPGGGVGGKRQNQQQQQQVIQQQAASRRRNFSVSTIGEDELAKCRDEQQRLLDVCQRLRDRQAARQAAAEATARAVREAEEAARRALEPQPPPPPPTPPPPPEEVEQKPRKKSPRPASGKKKPAAAGKKKTQQRSGSVGSSSSQTGQSDAVVAPEAASSPPKSKLPRATKAAGGAGRGGKNASKKGRPAGKKATAGKAQKPSTPPPPPPSTQEPEQPPLPPQPDPIDLLADEIEAATVFHWTRQPGQLPDLPCPSSEAKSRQQLTKIWWKRQSFVGQAATVACDLV